MSLHLFLISLFFHSIFFVSCWTSLKWGWHLFTVRVYFTQENMIELLPFFYVEIGSMNVLWFRVVFSLNTCPCVERVSDGTDSCSELTGGPSQLGDTTNVGLHSSHFIIVLHRQDSTTSFAAWSVTIWHLRLPTDRKLFFWIKQRHRLNKATRWSNFQDSNMSSNPTRR